MDVIIRAYYNDMYKKNEDRMVKLKEKLSTHNIKTLRNIIYMDKSHFKSTIQHKLNLVTLDIMKLLMELKYIYINYSSFTDIYIQTTSNNKNKMKFIGLYTKSIFMLLNEKHAFLRNHKHHLQFNINMNEFITNKEVINLLSNHESILLKVYFCE